MSARNERRQWQLTDFQRVLVVLTVVVAGFLAAMALGGSNLRLFLIAVGLLVIAVLSVFLYGLRRNAVTNKVATAYVVAVSPLPPGVIVAKCDIKLRVSLNGRPPVEVKYRDVALAVERWPRVGQTLPVDVEPNTKHVRVRWDLIDQGYAPAPDPTPPRSYQPPRFDAAQRDASPPVRLHTQYADPALNEYDEDPAFDGDYATVRTPVPAVDPYAAAMGGDGREPDETDGLHQRGRTVRTDMTEGLEVIHLDFDPADVDRSDFEPTSTATHESPPPAIPTPRPAEQPTMRISGSGTAGPADDEANTHTGQPVEGASIGGMLIVSDLDRSLRFYSEKLGFTIVYAASGNAVVEYGGARILLQHMADFSGIDRKVGHLHIQVHDLDAAYDDLTAKGVSFRYRPKMVSRSDDVELWKAAFDDPDGHGVALTEWRYRR